MPKSIELAEQNAYELGLEQGYEEAMAEKPAMSEQRLISAIAAESSGDERQITGFLAALMSVTGLTIEELTQHMG